MIDDKDRDSYCVFGKKKKVKVCFHILCACVFVCGRKSAAVCGLQLSAKRQSDITLVIPN